MTISQRIKKRRKALGLTQEQLAKRVGTTRIYITYVETGVKVPSLAMLKTIASALECKAGDLIDD